MSNDLSVSSVFVNPGETEFTKIFLGPNSIDNDLVRPSKPNFVVEYKDLNSFDTCENIDVILTILPPFGHTFRYFFC